MGGESATCTIIDDLDICRHPNLRKDGKYAIA
jgi:hypothetical protein